MKAVRLVGWCFVVVAGGVLLAYLLGWLYTMTDTSGHELVRKLVGFVFESAILFGFVIRSNRRFWRRPTFWVAFAVFFGARSLALFSVVRWSGTFPALLWGVMLPLEYALLSFLLGLSLRLLSVRAS